MSRCLIFANGTLPDLDAARQLLRSDDFIICADGGTRHALALGLTPSVVIGDLDSISVEERRKMKDDGIEMAEFPRDKNETDLELALDYAIEHGCREIVILAALGGRLDQTLGNLSLLTNFRLSTFDLKLDDGVESASFCRARSEVQGRRGDLVSLIPWGGEVRGVCTEGLRWPLSNETLVPHKTRGISNEMTGDLAHIEIESGILLIIHRRQS
ncbi:MAG: thiamine diphosphokinase [Anaerolineaceae bacterium]|nr:MAG: thiamine diphosphokinase [Anaerolineaceae bacterium]